MKTIRKGVFETNSSSTHSLVIMGDGEFEDLSRYEGEVLEVFPGEYGWEIEDYHSFEEKLSYAYTYAVNYEEEKLDILETFLINNLKVSKVKFKKNKEDFYKYGYIDHQSIDTASEIFENINNLRFFLLGKNSYFKTDNDNH